MLVRRTLGMVMLLIGILGIALSIIGTISSRTLIDDLFDSFEKTLDSTSQSLDTAEETLLLAKTTVDQVNDALDTVGSAAINLSETMSQTRPLLAEISQIISGDLPDTVEAFQSAIPGMAQSAAVIDDTLIALSNLRIEREILGFPLRFDLGIDYAPEVPFEESINQIGDSLEGLPARLRGLESHVETADGNLETISQDIIAMSADLEAINSSIAAVAPLLDDYVQIVTEAHDLIGRMERRVLGRMDTVKLVATLLMVWIGLTQIAPLYLGWELVTGRRD
jgi:ABC-type transporter Mla subunit MlaD